MIRFCDKEVYSVIEGEMTRNQMLMFFLSETERRYAVIAVYSEERKFQGIITYESLLKNKDIDLPLNPHTVKITDALWKDARSYFDRHDSSDNLLTVVDASGQIQGFAYDDNTEEYDDIRLGLIAMEKADRLPALEGKEYERIRMIVIMDLNEFAWRCYGVLKKHGYQICVIGEKWEWFGLKSGQGYMDYPEYAKCYIYAEGNAFLREENLFSESRYNNVSRTFDFIRLLVSKSMKYIYNLEVEKLIQQGIAVYEYIVPSRAMVEQRTELEEKSIEFNVAIDRYLMGKNDLLEDEMECIFEIYGKEKVTFVKETGDREAVKAVPMGNLLGESLKDVRYRKRIYIIGACIARGLGCLKEESLSGHLQLLVNHFDYQIVSIIIPQQRFDLWQHNIEKIPVRQSDIIIFINDAQWFPNNIGERKQFDLLPVFNTRNRKTMFCGVPIHTNAEGNRAIANAIYNQLLKDRVLVKLQEESNIYLQKGELLNESVRKEIADDLKGIKKNVYGRVGAIVMNCNPFTYGHRYLIEFSARKVDLLYVFVVEENRSFFKFNDRIEMVRKGTEDLQNVVVVPSGKWVLSYETLPSYFEKETRQEVEIDATLDLEIFARYIASELQITKRFVGEEPKDKITKQYNEQMKEVLGDFGIDVEEIPRIERNGRPISASYVRECMKKQEWEEIKGYVPTTSYDICLKYKE